MKLRKWNIRLGILAFLGGATVNAQDSTEKRNRLLPDHMKVQFAGGTGMLSIGAGYANKKQWLEGDLFYGYVPKSVGGLPIHSLTGKLTAFPFKMNFSNMRVRPLGFGLMANYTFGKQYFGFTPHNYPFEYYGFPTSLHAGAFVGGQLNFNRRQKKTKQVGLYYEVITFDSELISYLGNKGSLKIGDIINIGFGARVGF